MLADMRGLDGPLPGVSEIRRRLETIIPPQLDTRGFARRELAAKTIFVMLYGYAVEGLEIWIRPTAVTDMTDEQAARRSREERLEWLKLVQSHKRPKATVGRWYGENSRESIRDETLRALVDMGAVIDREGLPTTSSKPRYALSRSFAELFSSSLMGEELERAISEWQEKNLSAAALARITLARRGVSLSAQRVLVRLPSGETRALAPGPSSLLTKDVVEAFAPRFLVDPAVILLSESARKLTYTDEDLSRRIGLRIRTSESLPDVILVDIGVDPPLLVFVECVVTDGAVTSPRREDLEGLAVAAGYRPSGCAFVTAFQDRSDSPFRKIAGSLAWGTFAWFATEPDALMFLREGSENAVNLSMLLRCSE